MKKIFKYILAFILTYTISFLAILILLIILGFLILVFTLDFELFNNYFSSGLNLYQIKCLHGMSIFFGLISIQNGIDIIDSIFSKIKNYINNKKKENMRKKKLYNLFNKNLVD
jgi:uncharacterized metal-binding protein